GLIGHGSTLCFIQPQLSPVPAPPKLTDSPPPPGRDGVGRAEDPYAQPAQGTVIAQKVWDRMPGLEVLRAQLADELPPPPIHYLTGLAVQSASVDAVEFTLPATEWLCAPLRGRVQGGAVALLGETALSAAIQAR